MKPTIGARVGIWFFTGFLIAVTGFSLWHALSGLVWLVMNPAVLLRVVPGVLFILGLMALLLWTLEDVTKRLR